MTGLAEALVKAQAEMPAVPKTKEVEVVTKTGSKFKYKYATLDDLIAATLPVLNRNGLAIVQLPVQTDGGMPGLRTIIVHSSGEEMAATMPLAVGQGMQELGSAITYARRYAWSAALGIASEHDDDGNHAQQSSVHAADTAQATQQATGSTVISEAQAKRLYAISKAKNVDADTMKRLIKEVAGVESSKAVPRAKYEELVAAVEMAGLTAGAPAGGGVADADIPFEPTLDATV